LLLLWQEKSNEFDAGSGIRDDIQSRIPFLGSVKPNERSS